MRIFYTIIFSMIFIFPALSQQLDISQNHNDRNCHTEETYAGNGPSCPEKQTLGNSEWRAGVLPEQSVPRGMDGDKNHEEYDGQYHGIISSYMTEANAAWAGVMVSLFVGFISIIMLYKTIHETRESTKETRRIGEAQVRAYVYFDKIDFSHNHGDNGDKFIEVITKWKNNGVSPAINFGINAFIVRIDNDDIGNEIRILSNSIYNVKMETGIISSGDSIVQRGIYISEDLYREWEVGGCNLGFYSAVVYNDIFGKTHRAESCHIAKKLNKDMPDSKIGFIVYPHHNKQQSN